jgi:hypothetical protein
MATVVGIVYQAGKTAARGRSVDLSRDLLAMSGACRELN